MATPIQSRLIELARMGRIEIREDGSFRNPQNGRVYGLKPGKGRYVVISWLDLEAGEHLGANAHTLVWRYFKGDIPLGMQVNHIDGNSRNNATLNLELMTPAENTRHAIASKLSEQVAACIEAEREAIAAPEAARYALERLIYLLNDGEVHCTPSFFF